MQGKSSEFYRKRCKPELSIFLLLRQFISTGSSTAPCTSLNISSISSWYSQQWFNTILIHFYRSKKGLGSKRFDYSVAKLLGVWPSHEASSSQAPPRTRGKRHCSGVVSYILALQVKMTWIPFQSNMLWRQVYHWDCVVRQLDNKGFTGMNKCKWRTTLHL